MKEIILKLLNKHVLPNFEEIKGFKLVGIGSETKDFYYVVVKVSQEISFQREMEIRNLIDKVIQSAGVQAYTFSINFRVEN